MHTARIAPSAPTCSGRGPRANPARLDTTNLGALHPLAKQNVGTAAKAPKVPKKGGAGGKFTWGVPGDELKDDGFMSDMKDPNYDPDDKEPFRLDSLQPRLEGTQLKSVIDKTLTSYLKVMVLAND